VSSIYGFIFHLTYLVQPPYLGKSENTKSETLKTFNIGVRGVDRATDEAAYVQKRCRTTTQHRSVCQR